MSPPAPSESSRTVLLGDGPNEQRFSDAGSNPPERWIMNEGLGKSAGDVARL